MQDMGDLGYPPTLDNKIESNLLFKINVKMNNIEKKDRVYTVSNICQDDDLVRQYLPEDFFNQTHGTFTEMGGSNSLEVSQAVINLNTDCDDHYSVGTGEDSVSTKTPGKRTVNEQTVGSAANETELDGQLSTNKFTGSGGNWKEGKASYH
ncbi:hypothetical protein PIB30_027997 [Stylosanthes scabra]|uniref:Uncharacterized protein n=1 Tax=Stylosanthes scabra TaxID=79078 RepID=A0ABU6W9D7_9FABA|nr:hypothetical protein [Stylosanthes scabra]